MISAAALLGYYTGSKTQEGRYYEQDKELYKMAKGGAFRSKSYMKTYARDHDLIK